MRRKSGDRFQTRYVKNMITVMGSDECTTREVINRMISKGWRQIPLSGQVGMLMKTSGFFEKVGMDRTRKSSIWKVRIDKANERGWFPDQNSD